MCDYSLQNVTSRSAKVGDKLITRDFGTGTRGFAGSEDKNVAVCVRPGTELSFVREVKCQPIGILCGPDKVIKYKTAVFRQINKERLAANHDALEFPDGQIVLLTCLREGQVARVLQLPAEAKTVGEVKAAWLSYHKGRWHSRVNGSRPAVQHLVRAVPNSSPGT